jgi:hypothetical protein
MPLIDADSPLHKMAMLMLPMSWQVPSLEQVMEWSAPMLCHRPMNDRRAENDRSPAAFTEDASASGSKATAATIETRFIEPSLSIRSGATGIAAAETHKK